MFFHNIYTIAAPLFLVINVIGNIPLFVALLARFDPKHQRRIILREMLIALAILLLFNFFGDHILALLGITRPIIGIAGGFLLILIALMMIFPKHGSEAPPLHEPIVVPLAMPTVAGPGAITAVMVFSHQAHSPLFMTLNIFIAWIPSLIIVLLASNIKRCLGEKGLMACERLGGMLVMLIAIQMLTSGIIGLVKDNFGL